MFAFEETQKSSRVISNTCTENCWVTRGAKSAGKMPPHVRAQKHERSIAAWLWCNLLALAGIFTCFWLFVIVLINECFRLVIGRRPVQCRFDALADPFLAPAIGS
jgi:hypothetical protein